MSSSQSPNKYVQQTLTMPQNMPLFNYNLNFQGLRSLIQTLNIQTNTNSQQIAYLKQQLATKLHSSKLQQQQQQLNHSVKLGLSSEKVLGSLDGYHEKDKNGKEENNMNNMELYSHKMGKFGRILQHLVNSTSEHKEKIYADQNKHQKNIDQSFRRLQQKINSSLDSMTKNINLYFNQTNKKVASLQTDLSTQKRQTSANFQSVNFALNQRISQPQLKAAINNLSQQVKTSMLKDLNDDQMKRLALMNEYSTKLQNHMTDSQLKAKSVKQTVKELQQRVVKALPLQSFQIQKHKIFQKLSEYKNKIDDLTRKNQQFVDFRKNFYETNQRVKHNMMEIQDQIKKLGQKGSSFKKMENIGDILANLDPHLICQIGNQVKLHQKQIGKIQKQVAYLQSELQSARNGISNKTPEVNNGQTADIVIKLIKQYMANLDFDGRVKRAQKQIHDVSKRSDGVNQLQKKLYNMTKDIDVSAIMKQIKKKSDDDSTRRDFKIIDSKVQKLFQFYKQLRRDIQELFKKSSRISKQSTDNASLTTKKLYGPNCLSCTTSGRRPQSQRNYSKSKMDMSIGLDQSIDHIKHSMYVKGTTH